MKKLLILFIFLAMSYQMSASHIVGGNLYVSYVSGNTYTISLTIWRDCSGIDFDNTTNKCKLTNPLTTINSSQSFTDSRYLNQRADIILGVFDGVTNNQIDSLYMTLQSRKILSLGDSCFKPNMCIEEGVYSQNITLNNNPNGYYITWQRCCRNSVILNATDPTNSGSGSAAMVFYVAVPDPALHNSTPQFGSYPQAYMCANKLNTITDFKATDKDGDVLVYSLVDPLNGTTTPASPGQLFSATTTNASSCIYNNGLPSKGPYSTLNWRPPYSLSNIVGGSPAMAINSSTGVITASPTTLGIYVFAVRVEEYRNGVKIGEIRREVQYQVITCGGNAPPSFSQPIAGNYKSYTIVTGDSLCIPITLNDPDANDSITITASGDLLNNPKLNGTSFTPVKGHKNGTTELCLTSSCESIQDAAYKVQFIGKDYSCYGSNTVTLDVDVFVKSKMEGKINTVPNVFSPNGDSKNDYFQLNAVADYCANPFSIKIFDRWGLKVYESNELDFKWDGKYMKNGKDLTEGVYYYIISANFSHSTFENHGFVQLLR